MAKKTKRTRKDDPSQKANCGEPLVNEFA
ncbi:MAG: hypothetical protein JWN69_1598, partial [Alphaproteobacteria bacterium]|nr:hypothetical protein [Alphaproteobacteria bacterium]